MQSTAERKHFPSTFLQLGIKQKKKKIVLSGKMLCFHVSTFFFLVCHFDSMRILRQKKNQNGSPVKHEPTRRRYSGRWSVKYISSIDRHYYGGEGNTLQKSQREWKERERRKKKKVKVGKKNCWLFYSVRVRTFYVTYLLCIYTTTNTHAGILLCFCGVSDHLI